MRPVRVRVRETARQDLIGLVQWYDEQQPGLGVRLRGLFAQRLDRLAEFPEMHTVVHGELRRSTLPGFPVLIYYRFEDEIVTVAAVLHGAEDLESRLDGR